MTAADGYAREVAEFLDVWDAAPAHRTRYRDVISSQKSGEDGRKLRATTLRGLLAEVQRLREEREDLAEKLAAATRTVVRVAESRDEALALLDRGVDDDPCDVDQHGLCQAHWLSPEPCRNAEARRLLGLDTPGGAA